MFYIINFNNTLIILVPHIDERLQKEIHKHRCHNMPTTDAVINGAFSSTQSFKVMFFLFHCCSILILIFIKNF